MRALLLLVFSFQIVLGQDHRVPQFETFKSRDGYVFSFNEARKVSNWVGYVVKATDVQGVELGNKVFFKDSLISSCPTPKDYERYGYAQGHLKPRIASRNSKKDIKAINNYLNVAPMDIAFDKGVWRILENMVAGWAVTFDSVTVITGPIYENKKTETIGDNKVNVPDKFFKVVLVDNGMDMGGIAFVIPNNGDANNLKKYSMSVDSLETITGYNFFPDLPDYKEFYLEEKINPLVWKNESASYRLKLAFPSEGRCVASLKTDERCTVQTVCVTQNCWQHGCDIKEADQIKVKK